MHVLVQSDISNLYSLKELNLDSTFISDIKPLENLTNLQSLSYLKTFVSDINPTNLYIPDPKRIDLLEGETDKKQLKINFR